MFSINPKIYFSLVSDRTYVTLDLAVAIGVAFALLAAGALLTALGVALTKCPKPRRSKVSMSEPQPRRRADGSNRADGADRPDVQTDVIRYNGYGQHQPAVFSTDNSSYTWGVAYH